MKTVHIKAHSFFEMLKLRDTPMWDVFAQMIDGEEKFLIFVGEKEEVLFTYTLPKTVAELKEDQKIFAKEYAEKIAELN